MSDSKPLFEINFRYSLVIKPQKGLNIDNSDGDNYITRIVIAGHEVDLGQNPRKTAKHKLMLLDTSLPLLHELIRHNNTDLEFLSDYFYLHKKGSTTKSKSYPDENFVAIGPVSAENGENVDERKHIVPALFHRNEGPAPIHEYFKLDGNTRAKLAFYSEKDDSKRINLPIPNMKKHKNNISMLSKAGHVTLKVKLIRFVNNESGVLKFSFDMEVKYYRYFWGEYVRVLPIPLFPKPGKMPGHGLLLGLGDCWWEGIWQSISKMNPILLAGDKQTVLIQGEPGSGKEVFSNALHFGAVRPRTGKQGFKARSVANISNDNLSVLLYGKTVDGARISGLINDARGGTLFLDEFDKIKDPGSYSELLRVLESGEYTPKDGAQVENVNDVNWIFAGAFTGVGSSMNISDLPPDFWSRLTAQIFIENPLKFKPQTTQNGKKISYAGAIFAYFILREAVSFAEGVTKLLALEPGFPADYIQKLFIEPSTLNSEWSVSEGFNMLMENFQCGIENGRYRRLDQLSSKVNDIPDVISKYWTDNPRIQHHGRYKISEISYQASDAYDSVRSIIKAAQAAFISLKNESMISRDFWPGSGKKKADQDAMINDIFTSAAKRAVDIVRDARPGKYLQN